MYRPRAPYAPSPTTSQSPPRLILTRPLRSVTATVRCCRTWQEGKVLVIDDSFEHDVWNEGTESRFVLIVDIWHPELTEEERRTLTSI